MPQIDFTQSASELTRGLRDDYGVNFDDAVSAEEPLRYYFRKQKSSRDISQFVGDHYLLEVYLSSSGKTGALKEV